MVIARSESLKRTNTGQKIAFSVAMISYFLALVCIIFAGIKASEIGTENPIFASLAASVVFFVGAGIVLHVIGTVSLPNLKIPKNEKGRTDARDDE